MSKAERDIEALRYPIAGNNAVKKLTLTKLSVFAEYTRRTILGNVEERGRIRGRILTWLFVVV